MFKIYVLEKNGQPFYIGKAKNAIRRYYGHKRVYGLDIELNIIDEVEDWRFWENYWIEQFKQWGFILENKNNGGGGPTHYTEEQKTKMRKPRKKGTGKKISKTLLDRNHSQYYTEEVRQKMSKKLKGVLKPFSKEHIVAMGKAKRKQAKPVLQYDLNENFIKEWESKGQAASWIQITQNRNSNVASQIKDCILGKQKTAFGYKWKYK